MCQLQMLHLHYIHLQFQNFFQELIYYSVLHRSMIAALVTPLRQCSPVEVQISLFTTIKKFVELHVDTKP